MARTRLNNTEPHAYRQVGVRLAACRRALGMDAVDICREMNFRQNTYSQWESGKSRVNLDDAIRLCDRYGVTLDFLYRNDISGVRSDLARRITEEMAKA